jgi:hypothetical protein
MVGPAGVVASEHADATTPTASSRENLVFTRTSEREK